MHKFKIYWMYSEGSLCLFRHLYLRILYQLSSMVVEAPTLQLCIAQSRWKNLNEYLQMFQCHLKSIAI